MANKIIRNVGGVPGLDLAVDAFRDLPDERLVVVGDGRDLEALQAGASEELKQVKKVARQKSVENVERHFVLAALKRNEWNVTRAAEETGMQRSNFQALMAKYDIRIRGVEHDKDE